MFGRINVLRWHKDDRQELAEKKITNPHPMKTSDKVKILEDEVENLLELAGETLATCLVNIKRGNLIAADKPNGGAVTDTFKQYLTVRLDYLKQIRKRLGASKK